MLVILNPIILNDKSLCDFTTVRDQLEKLQTNKSKGSDQIPPFLLKSSAPDICEPVSFIYNLSFKSAKVPHVWKLADVVPVPKSLPVNLEKLRPISLLPILGKVLEKLILKKYYVHLMSSVDKSQFAYRSNSSTVCALLAIHDKIVTFLDDQDITAVRIVTFDMSHAFDCVPHDVLMSRIFALNFPDCTTFSNWIKNYLCHRRQRVRIGDRLSSVVDVPSGVPQGSVVGPQLFSIFMSSYSACDSNTLVTKYADDVTLVIPVFKDSSDVLQTVNNEINHFQNWCSNNHMKINQQKTNVLNINTARSLLPSVPNLCNVKSLKILGLIFNEDLSWINHFDYVISKMSSRLYVLRMLKPLLSHDELVNVYNAIIRSIVEYASSVFLSPGKCLDLRLLRFCKRAFYIIHGENVRHCDLCDITAIVERRRINAMKLFKEIKSNPNHVLHHLLPLTSSRSNRLILPHAKTMREVNSFIFSCSMLYNDTL